ncbi:ATP-grasp domain-containing protein [Evansella tamaricis]|uniref:ATP-grasp domain-containing protein n=1 Tax=Evansella tamaricis TaxID=2069301 RepID=A0ABS6JBE9_9BACI|nr:hypothetical protein [Evansella tamaricis]MBU9711004.1 hypothetical protein [Evansella tamaricis]
MKTKNHHGLLVYREEDINRNRRFISLLMEGAKKVNLSLSLVPLETFRFSVTSEKGVPFTLDHEVELRGNHEHAPPSFLINRSVSPWLNELVEKKGIRVMNSPFLSRIANDKRLTHAYFHSKGIPMLETFSLTKTSLLKNHPFPVPYIIKDPYGRGGTGVHHIQSDQDVQRIKDLLPEELVGQPVCDQPGKDLRVYIVANKIVGAVLRESTSNDIRANISTGGKSSLYKLSKGETMLVEQMMDGLTIDFAGIDFLFDLDGNLLFNEMEDSVGCRSLYMNSSINIADVFMKHVAGVLAEK